MSSHLITTEKVKDWLNGKPTPPMGGAVPMGFVWGLCIDLLEARGEVYPYDMDTFKKSTKFQITPSVNTVTSKHETSITFRGSISDLATDLAPLLSAEDQIKLGEDLILRVKHK